MTAAPHAGRPRAVLFDRDGTLLVDVPYNGNPDRVTPMPGAAQALERLRAEGIPTAVVSNQSGIARGLLTREQVDAVNARMEQLLGPVGPVFVCEHGPDDGCTCRKPAPGMVHQAAAALDVPPTACAVIGDIGADVGAALAAGARPVLVPTEVTRREEIDAAPEVAPDLDAAISLLLDGPTMTGTALVARLDSDGDVLLAGPAMRAVAAGADRVVVLAGPRGAAAARLLPGVDEVVVWHCPWIDAEPQPVDPASVHDLVEQIRGRAIDRALVLTSFHQSPLPLALVLRLAGVPWIGASSEDFPGTLLDLRHRLPETGLHEAQRQLLLAEAAGYALPAGDDGGLRVRADLPDTADLTGAAPYVVVHPGASVPARAPSPDWAALLVRELAAAGHRVVVTGGPAERALTAHVAADAALDLGGATDLASLADVLARASCVVVGNTGPAHLAAAVGTPVVSLFAPVVPAERWRPWQVRSVLLGDQSAPCALTRAKHCPVPDHPCLNSVPVRRVVDAVRELTPHAHRSLEVSA